MLTGLIRCAARVIEIGRAALFDVRAQDVRDGMRADEIGQPLGAGDVSSEIGDIETAGIETVAGKEVSGFAIVERDAGFVMAGNSNHVDERYDAAFLDELDRLVSAVAVTS